MLRTIGHLVALVTVLGATTVHAQGLHCFGITKARGSKDASALRVTLATPLSVHAQCEYALHPEGPFRSDLAGGVADFASLAAALQPADTQPPLARPAAVYARTKALPGSTPGPRLASVFLESACEYLLHGERGVSVSVPAETQQPLAIRKGEANACAARELGFAFVAASDARPSAPPFIAKGPFERLLAAGDMSLVLEPGSYAVYAAGPSGLGYLIGELTAGQSLSPLRASLRARARGEGKEPWFLPAWTRSGLRFTAASPELSSSDLWAELRAGASAGAVWLARGATAKEASPLTVLGKLLIERDGEHLALPSELLAARMHERYGDAARAMTPTLGDLRRVVAGLSLCLGSRYAAALPAVGGPSPRDATCALLSELVAPPHAQRSGLPSGTVCLQRRAHRVAVAGTGDGGERGRACVRLPTGAPDEPEPPVLVASTGDSLFFGVADTRRLFVCEDNRCRAVPAGAKPLRLERSALLELRFASDRGGAHSSMALALLRVGVIDPSADWHPIGLAPGRAAPETNRWKTLDHDERDVFAFVRGYDALDFAVTPSPALVAAWNGRPSAPTRMVRELPRVRATTGTWLPTPRSALVTLATRTASCPDKAAADLTNADLAEPEHLPVDSTFHVHLALYTGDAAPYRCLATARLRVTERASVRLTGALRAGLLGDTQAVVFVSDPPALGLAVPIAYARYRLVAGLGLDAAAALTMASAFDTGELSRAGAGLSAGAHFGPDEIAPRLFSVGAMLHAAISAHAREPRASLYLAVDLSTLYDLAGGR